MTHVYALSHVYLLHLTYSVKRDRAVAKSHESNPRVWCKDFPELPGSYAANSSILQNNVGQYLAPCRGLSLFPLPCFHVISCSCLVVAALLLHLVVLFVCHFHVISI